jgi:tetratricopeptide (TPR) repeat protein
MSEIVTGAVLKDRYELRHLLGRGGMAAVWLGQDEVLDRTVAIKVLSDTLAADPDFLARFRREATVAAGLSHPNLVGVYDYSETGERPYLVMEFVPGENLGALIARHFQVDRSRLARELLGAVAHIHAAGIIHRDIKPHNILLGDGGTAKLIDFGIALPQDATSLTQTGMILGTKRYAAPEVTEGQPANERSDLYSCGVVLRACAGSGTAALESLVANLTEADPSRRPESARQALLEVKDRAVQGRPTEPFIPTFASSRKRYSQRQPEQTTPTRVLSPSVSRRKRWSAAVAILVVAAAIAAAVIAATSSGGSSSPGAHASGTAGAHGKARGSENSAQRSEGAAPKGAAAEEAVAVDAEATEAEVDETEVSEAAAQPASTAVAAGTDPELGSALNQEGFELIQAGRYEEAVLILEESVRAFPRDSGETEYAYALFNLGDALRLSGRPEEAIPVLEQRLEIPNQTGVVRRELDAALREAG